jgi:Ser/Thr protein kinase RdoA (MazF antagonist)
MVLNEILLKNVMPRMGLTAKGEFSCPRDGRIAHNRIVFTVEQGAVLLRCYPIESNTTALGYGIQQAKFELRVLNFLAQHRMPTPKPIKFLNENEYAALEDGWFIFAYPLEEGRTLEQSDMNETIAK